MVALQPPSILKPGSFNHGVAGPIPARPTILNRQPSARGPLLAASRRLAVRPRPETRDQDAAGTQHKLPPRFSTCWSLVISRMIGNCQNCPNDVQIIVLPVIIIQVNALPFCAMPHTTLAGGAGYAPPSGHFRPGGRVGSSGKSGKSGKGKPHELNLGIPFLDEIHHNGCDVVTEAMPDRDS